MFLKFVFSACLVHLILNVFSSEDWKYGAEQFVKRLPGKVIVHRKYLFSLTPGKVMVSDS